MIKDLSLECQSENHPDCKQETCECSCHDFDNSISTFCECSSNEPNHECPVHGRTLEAQKR